MPEVTFPVSECVYSWNAAYSRANNNIVVRIKLEPQYPIGDQALNDLKERWRAGILSKWDNKNPCPPSNSNLRFDVEFVDSNAHHTVKIHRGPRRSNMTNWDDADDGHAASHEYGHMLGLPDEYPDSNCPNRSPTGTGTVMEQNTGSANQRLIHRVCERSPSEPPQLYVNPSADDIDFSQPMKFMLRVAGGRGDERLESVIQADEESRIATVATADALKDIAPTSSTGGSSPDLLDALHAHAKELLLQPQQIKAPQILPDSLVGQLNVTIGSKEFRYVFPVDENDMPQEEVATAPSHPFSQLMPSTPTNSIKEIHNVMTSIADQAECPCEEGQPQEQGAPEEDFSHLSPDQLTLFHEIRADEALSPKESPVSLLPPPERQTHRVPLGKHKLPNEVRGCWRHAVDTRSARIEVWVELSHPSLFDFLNKAIGCALGCAGTTIVVAIATGLGAAVAIPAFKACFYACLAAQVGHSVAREVKIELGSNKTTGGWSGH